MATAKSFKADVLTKGKSSKRQLLNSLRWPIYIINLVNNTKLPIYTLSPMQHHSFFINITYLFNVSITFSACTLQYCHSTLSETAILTRTSIKGNCNDSVWKTKGLIIWHLLFEGLYVCCKIDTLGLQTITQRFGDKTFLQSLACLWVNEITSGIDEETKKRHSCAVLVEKQVWMRTE